MGPARYLILLAVVGAAAAQGGVRSICEHDRCSCQERDGLEHVTCDCGGAGDAQPLLVGDSSKAHVSDRTGSLRVRRCGQVSLVSEALSDASRLSDLELSDIDRLELQPRCLYRAADGPPRRVTVQRVVDLRIDPLAFQGVKRLQQLEFLEVAAGNLPLHSFSSRSDVLFFRLVDSRAENVRLGLDMANVVKIIDCVMESLDVAIGHVVDVTINDNTISTMRRLQLNTRVGPHSTDADVTIARNNISSLPVDSMRMSVDRLDLVNNTLNLWMAPLRVEFYTAIVTGNDIERLGDLALREFVRLNAVNLRSRRPITKAAEFIFTFSHNTVRASSHGQYDSILTPTDSESRETTLFAIDRNRFSCDCFELTKLVRDGEKQLKSVQGDDDGLFQWDQVYGQLYRTSTCLGDGRSLQQYRQDAFTDDLECLPTSAAAATTGTLTLLLAATTTIGLTS